MGIAMKKQQQPPATLPSRPATAGLALNQSVAEGPKAIAAVRFCGVGTGEANKHAFSPLLSRFSLDLLLVNALCW